MADENPIMAEVVGFLDEEFGDPLPRAEICTRPANTASQSNDQMTHLSLLLDAFFMHIGDAQHAEKVNNLTDSARHYALAVAAADSAIPLQEKLPGGDPRTLTFLSEKRAEFSARQRVLLDAIESSRIQTTVGEGTQKIHPEVQDSVSVVATEEAKRRPHPRTTTTTTTTTPKTTPTATLAASVAAASEREALARVSLAAALRCDEAGRSGDALPLYMAAAEQYLACLDVYKAAAIVSSVPAEETSVAAAPRGSEDGEGLFCVGLAEREATVRAAAGQVIERIETIKIKQVSDTSDRVVKSTSTKTGIVGGGGVVGKLSTSSPLSPPPPPPPPAAATFRAASVVTAEKHVGKGAVASGGGGRGRSGPSGVSDKHSRKGSAGGSGGGSGGSGSGGNGGNSGRGGSGGVALTSGELDVLRRTSKVHGFLFLPWGLDAQQAERFRYPNLFEDPDGLLPLAQKQREQLGGWRRPSEFVPRASSDSASVPVMIRRVSPLCITQDLVGDCSFVASLCICAAFEKRFQRRLVTGLVFPQDSTGNPVYNPCGKYVVKLWCNGCERRVVVDDRLPCDKSGKLMTCYSNDKRELWVSIIEKAYMKLNGGYDFPGSNSGIDLYALTGWLPESVSFTQRDKDKEPTAANARKGEPHQDSVWRKLESAHRHGDCLVTMATSNALPEAEAERAGLVPGHAYAVLDVREVSLRAAGLPFDAPGAALLPGAGASGAAAGAGAGAAGAGGGGVVRLLLVKNPWAKKRWRGNYSAEDERHWTPQLRALLGYDPDTAKAYDNGVFWIDYGAVRHYFQSLHLNWNPALFAHRRTVHHHWPKEQGPESDTYNYGDNPQFTLTVDLGAPAPGTVQTTAQTPAPPSVWVLLSRHVCAKESEEKPEAHDARGIGSGGGGGGGGGGDGADSGARDFVTVHVYDDDTGEKSSQRVFSPGKPLLQGVYSANPHTLVKIDVAPSLPPPAAASQLSSHQRQAATTAAQHQQHQQQRQRCKKFTLVVSQYRKLRDVDFTLTALCTTAPVSLALSQPLPQHALAPVRGQWTARPSNASGYTAGGSLGHPRFFTNPMWCVAVPGGGGGRVRLHAELLAPKEVFVALRLVKHSGGGRVDGILPADTHSTAHNAKPPKPPPTEAASSGAYTNGFCYLDTCALDPGCAYTLVASTFEPGTEASFVLKVFTSALVSPLRALPPEGDGLQAHRLQGFWGDSTGSGGVLTSTAAGSPNHGRYGCNPLYKLIVSKRTAVQARLQLLPDQAALKGTRGGGRGVALSLALFRVVPSGQAGHSGLPLDASPQPAAPQAGSDGGGGNSSHAVVTSNKGVYTSATCGVTLSKGGASVTFDAGSYLLVPSTFDPWHGQFQLAVYTAPAGAHVSQVQ